MRLVRVPRCTAAWEGLAVCVAFSTFACLAAEQIAQVRVRQIGLDQPAGGDAGVLVLADRRMIQRLREAAEQIDAKNYLVALEHLQRLVEAPEDAFFHPEAGERGHYRSLRAEAERLIGTLPREAQEIYERQYGPTARALLSEAVETGRLDGLADVSRRFFHTRAGYEATYRLAVAHFDHGLPLAAALGFERLRRQPDAAAPWEPALSVRAALAWSRAGQPESAERLLKEIAASYNGRRVAVAGHAVVLDEQPADPEGWLQTAFGPAPQPTAGDQWSVFLGNPARNPVALRARESEDLELSIPTLIDPRRDPTDEAETALDGQLEHRVRDRFDPFGRRHPELFRMAPVIVGDVVAFRTFGDLTFFDLRTGDWRKSLIDLDIEPLLDDAEANGGVSEELIGLVGQRLWRDQTFGSLSTDGSLVYCIEDLGEAVALDRGRGSTREGRPAFNRLAAYDPQDGKLVWDVGGDPRDPFFVLPLAGTFFLGPPLPLGGSLYCLAEIENEIRLLVLEPTIEQGRTSARLLWEQPLAMASSGSIAYYGNRRMAGTTVSYADGVLVCPTGVGALIALDATTRSLLWAQRFDTNSHRPTDPVFGGRRLRGRRPIRIEPPQSGWVDSTAIIADGTVLFTPEHVDELYCLDLLDGSEIWSEPREDGLYVAGVWDGKVVLAGLLSVRALRLDSGDVVWKCPFPMVHKPSGRGLIVDGHLYVPLSSGEIAVIDLESGTLRAQTKTPGGRVPGNLVTAHGLLISQGVEAIEALPFPEIENAADQ